MTRYNEPIQFSCAITAKLLCPLTIFVACNQLKGQRTNFHYAILVRELKHIFLRNAKDYTNVYEFLFFFDGPIYCY